MEFAGTGYRSSLGALGALIEQERKDREELALAFATRFDGLQENLRQDQFAREQAHGSLRDCFEELARGVAEKLGELESKSLTPSVDPSVTQASLEEVNGQLREDIARMFAEVLATHEKQQSTLKQQLDTQCIALQESVVQLDSRFQECLDTCLDTSRSVAPFEQSHFTWPAASSPESTSQALAAIEARLKDELGEQKRGLEVLHAQLREELEQSLAGHLAGFEHQLLLRERRRDGAESESVASCGTLDRVDASLRVELAHVAQRCVDHREFTKATFDSLSSQLRDEVARSYNEQKVAEECSRAAHEQLLAQVESLQSGVQAQQEMLMAAVAQLGAPRGAEVAEMTQTVVQDLGDMQQQLGTLGARLSEMASSSASSDEFAAVEASLQLLESDLRAELKASQSQLQSDLAVVAEDQRSSADDFQNAQERQRLSLQVLESTIREITELLLAQKQGSSEAVDQAVLVQLDGQLREEIAKGKDEMSAEFQAAQEKHKLYLDMLNSTISQIAEQIVVQRSAAETGILESTAVERGALEELDGQLRRELAKVRSELASSVAAQQHTQNTQSTHKVALDALEARLGVDVQRVVMEHDAVAAAQGEAFRENAVVLQEHLMAYHEERRRTIEARSAAFVELEELKQEHVTTQEANFATQALLRQEMAQMQAASGMQDTGSQTLAALEGRLQVELAQSAEERQEVRGALDTLEAKLSFTTARQGVLFETVVKISDALQVPVPTGRVAPRR